MLYESNSKQIKQEMGDKVFICSKCGLPGLHDPVIVSEDGCDYYYHAKCIYITLKELGGKLPKLTSLELKEVKALISLRPKTAVKKILKEKKDNQPARLKQKRAKWDVKFKTPIVRQKILRVTKQSATMDLIDDKIIIILPYSKQLVSKFHYLNIKYDRLNKRWEVLKFKDFELIKYLYNIHKEIIQYSWSITENATVFIEKALAQFDNEYLQYKDIMEIKKMRTTDEDTSSYLKIQPFGYQKVGIRFLEAADGVGIIGDAMGLGKTLQSLGYTSKHNLRTVVVCPSSVKYKWLREIQMFTHKNGIILSEFKSPSPELYTNDYIIINYAQLSKYSSFLEKGKFDCVILDESQYIQASKSKRTAIVSKLFRKIKKKILLSGTPVKNRPIDFFTQLKFLKPELFKRKTSFGLRYCDAEYNEYTNGLDYKGASNLRELYIKIDTFFIRRLKKDVLKELPHKTSTVLDLKLKIKDKQEYMQIIKGYKKEQSLLKLPNFIRLQQFLSLRKISMAVELVNQILEEDSTRKVIIFSQFIEVQNRLVSLFGSKCSSLLGRYSDKRREKEQQDFLKNPDKRVFIGSTKAAGVGIDLTSADTVIFLDLMFSPSDLLQAEDRAHRIGQKDPVSVFYLNYQDTIDEYLWEILKIKLDVLSQILDGNESSSSLTIEDVKLRLFGIFKEKY